MEKYVAFDFEMQNASPSSICSIGLVVVVDNQIVDTYYSLVKPQPFYQMSGCYHIHKIKSKDLSRAPVFSKVWKEVKHYFEGAIIVSHNVFQDSRALRAVLDHYHLPYPNCKMTCSLVLSKRLLPELESHKLSEINKHYNWGYKAHDALEDAKCTHALICTMMNKYSVDSLTKLCEHAKFSFGKMKPKYYKNVYTSELVHEEQYDVTHEFYEKNFCINKLVDVEDYIIEYIKNHGGFIQQKVNTSTDYYVRFDMMKTKNYKEALRLIDLGQDLQIINYKKLKNMIEKVNV